MFNPEENPETVVTDMLDMAETHARAPELTLRDLLADYGRQSFYPVLLLLGLMLVSPLSGIPLFSSAIGIGIFLTAAQGALGRDALWLPEFLLCRPMNGGRVVRMVEFLKSAGRWLDSISTERLSFMTSPPAARLLMTVCATVGLLFPFMEFVPFSSSILGGSVALIALSVLTRDGMITLAGLCSMAIALAIPISLFTVVTEG